MSAAECRHCRAPAPAEARFCPDCGRPLSGANEAGRRIRLDRFLLVALVGAGGLGLLVAGYWAWGVVVVLSAVILFLARRELERRRAARRPVSLRARAAAAGGAVAARSREQLELFRARRELAELDAQRARAFHDLGRALFYGEDAAAEPARATIASLVEQMREKESEIDRLREETEQRVGRARLHVQPTQRIDAAAREATPEDPRSGG
jgi:hypothetical protein